MTPATISMSQPAQVEKAVELSVMCSCAVIMQDEGQGYEPGQPGEAMQFPDTTQVPVVWVNHGASLASVPREAQSSRQSRARSRPLLVRVHIFERA